MKKVLFAISDSFPYGAAYAARTRALCKLFQSIGYETTVLCDYPSKKVNGDNTYGTIIYLAKEPYQGLSKLFKLPIDYKNKLQQVLSEQKFDFVVSRSMFDRFDGVLKTVKKFNTPILLESCEWYDVKGFARGKYDIRYLQFCHCFNYSYNRVDGVIAISRLLEEHYKEKRIKVIRIPGIHEVEKLPYRVEATNNDTVKLLFAGNIFGGKEQFEDLLIAITQISNKHKNIVLNIYGPSKESVLASLGQRGNAAYESIKDRVYFKGMVPQEKMAKVCKENDFGIFFRPDRRSSHAGFPTKLGEYLSAGTPVITNKTGDIPEILKHEVNGYLLSDGNSEEIKNVLEKCIEISNSEYEIMRKNARDTAMKMLDFSVYSDSLSDFLKLFR